MLGSRAEDYLEAIYSLSKEKGYAKVMELSEVLNVKPATVSEMLEKLSRMGYVEYKKRSHVKLTEKGVREAMKLREKRNVVIKFLKAIGVPEDVAERDACTIEHVLHPETLRQLRNFVRFVESSPAVNPRWLEHFREFCRTGRHPCKQR
ncbi:metal-dependent transcriptional regulator [Archaeoglobus fulgidus]|uniref:Iron-dependent repressor n=2 Tax=Archaeoglobus fulgidus TaxID=2234 RepID=O30276_ARCFU|nr:metal-dependent transcriptional regulator [Archaeoglobus fulgidus]AAB91276.1 iron-dependent repressor [Archaeoglobus fulgidus DSM 4304]KUJ94761.1 MAG: Iron-dependent repressor [Archaeoglobus fulgidus]KUK07200.1 MAG: Iron-dependent repressor [Archaeoglobus fulgidus]